VPGGTCAASSRRPQRGDGGGPCSLDSKSERQIAHIGLAALGFSGVEQDQHGYSLVSPTY
jgi:hypothetical protein